MQLTASDERHSLEDPLPDRYLLYTEDVQGGEKPNLYLLDLSEYITRNLTDTEKIGYSYAVFSDGAGDRCWGKTSAL